MIGFSNSESQKIHDMDTTIPIMVIDLVYPIGAVYTSTVNTNPGTWMNGTTWELLPDGYLRNNALAATGGSLTTESVVLTADQIPFIETESFESWIKKLPFRALF